MFVLYFGLRIICLYALMAFSLIDNDMVIHTMICQMKQNNNNATLAWYIPAFNCESQTQLSVLDATWMIDSNKSLLRATVLPEIFDNGNIYSFYYICLFNATLANAYSFSVACSRQCYSLYSLFFIIYCIFFKSFLLKFDFFLKNMVNF